MTDFEFFLSFYGLLLGLTLVEIATRMADAIGARRKIRIGWLSPALAVFVLFDITSFWMWAWLARDALHVSWALVFGGLVVAVVYFLAAALVFPRNLAEWDSLDAHYWQHKRIVIGGIIFANVASTAFSLAQNASGLNAFFFTVQAMYWIPLVGLLFSRRAWLDLTLLGVATMSYIVFSALAPFLH